MRKLITDRMQFFNINAAQAGEEVYPVVMDTNGNVKVNPERNSSPFIVKEFNSGFCELSGNLLLHSIIITNMTGNNTTVKISYDGGTSYEDHGTATTEMAINFGLKRVLSGGVTIQVADGNDTTFSAHAVLLQI